MEATRTSSTSGCTSSLRMSSAPPYPLPPMTAALKRLAMVARSLARARVPLQHDGAGLPEAQRAAAVGHADAADPPVVGEGALRRGHVERVDDLVLPQQQQVRARDGLGEHLLEPLLAAVSAPDQHARVERGLG